MIGKTRGNGRYLVKIATVVMVSGRSRRCGSFRHMRRRLCEQTPKCAPTSLMVRGRCQTNSNKLKQTEDLVAWRSSASRRAGAEWRCRASELAGCHPRTQGPGPISHLRGHFHGRRSRLGTLRRAAPPVEASVLDACVIGLVARRSAAPAAMRLVDHLGRRQVEGEHRGHQTHIAAGHVQRRGCRTGRAAPSRKKVIHSARNTNCTAR